MLPPALNGNYKLQITNQLRRSIFPSPLAGEGLAKQEGEGLLLIRNL